MSKLSFIMPAILITFFLLFPFPDFTYAQQVGVSGTVQSIDGLTLNGKIEVYQEDSLVQKTEANLDGQFLINLDSGSYTLIVWFDDPATNGHDYLPVKKDVKVPANNLVFQLTPSASIYIERDIQI